MYVFIQSSIHALQTAQPVVHEMNAHETVWTEWRHQMCTRIGCSLLCSKHLTGCCGTAHTNSRQSVLAFEHLHCKESFAFAFESVDSGLGCHRMNAKLPSSLRLLWLPLRFDASFLRHRLKVWMKMVKIGKVSAAAQKGECLITLSTLTLITARSLARQWCARARVHLSSS